MVWYPCFPVVLHYPPLLFRQLNYFQTVKPRPIFILIVPVLRLDDLFYVLCGQFVNRNHIVAPFLKKETELLTPLLYRQQPRKSTMALENLMPRLPHSAVCRHTCGTPHKVAVPVPGVLPLPAPA